MANVEQPEREDFEKQAYKIIRKAYYSPTGLSTPYKIYKDVNTVDKRITLELVRQWFRENIEKTKQVGGAKNSYVAQRAFQEYQADVFYITEKQMPNQEYPFGLSMIDVFSKYATVIPMKERKAENLMAAILQGFKDIGKQPDVLYTDEEGALIKKTVAPEFAKMGIQHIVTTSSAHFVERFNRTFKWMINQKVKDMKTRKRFTKKTTPIDTTKIQWHELAPSVLAVYNNKNKHRITGLTPAEARKPSSEADAKISMEIAATRGRRYPPLAVGDTVRILRKKKQVGDKEWMSNFKEGDHKVASVSENLGQKFYRLTDGREYLRADIVKM